MISGRKTLASIERAIDDIQRSEKRIQQELENANNKRIELEGKRTATIRELAELQIKNALADGIIDDVDRLAQRVKTMLIARNKTISAIKSRLEEIQLERQNNLKDCEQINSRIDELEEQLDVLAEQAQTELKDFADYTTTLEGIKQLQSTYYKAREKTEQAKENRKLKGKAYQDDPLFMYLWRRKFGSQEYKANRLTRYFDKKISQLVGYNDARANYAVLLEIPVRLEEHLNRLGDKKDLQQSKLDTIIADKIKQLAGRDLYNELKTARETEKSFHQEAEHLGAELSEITGQMNLYVEGQDHIFKKAIDITAEFIEQDNLEELRRLARQTRTAQDDEIIAALRSIDRDDSELQREISVKKLELGRLFDRKQELIQIAADFRRSHYDDPGSIFDQSGNLEIVLEELLRGAITGADYWTRAQRHHRWRDRPADPYRRQSPFPPLGGSVGHGSDLGQPEFRTGGGF